MRQRLGKALATTDQALALRDETPGDQAFLFQLYTSIRQPEMDVLDWPAEQKRAFLAQQQAAQSSHYRQHYPDARFLIVQQQAEPIGRIYLSPGSSELRLMEIALLPAARGAGIGSCLLAGVLQLALEDGLCVSLHVEPFNPAYAWYQRLGFQVVEQRGVYYFMRLPPEHLEAALAHARNTDQRVSEV